MKRTAEVTLEQAEAIRKQLAAGKDPRAIVLTRTKAVRKGAKLGEMNGLETEFAKFLEMQKSAGVIVAWHYECFRMRIAFGNNPAWIKTDFFVLYSDGSIRLFETKGFWREASRLRIKVAAGVYPWAKFIAVKRVKGQWEFENF